jgi:hypothetical protein
LSVTWTSTKERGPALEKNTSVGMTRCRLDNKLLIYLSTYVCMYTRRST